MPRGIQQIYTQLFETNAKLAKMLNAIIERNRQRSKQERSVEKLPEKFHNELPTKPAPQPPMELIFLTLLPTEPAMKPAPQFSELTPPQPPPPVSELLIPKVARVVKEHHIKHRVIEQIGFRSAASLRASFSAYISSSYPTIQLLDPQCGCLQRLMGTIGPRLSSIRQLSLFRR